MIKEKKKLMKKEGEIDLSLLPSAMRDFASFDQDFFSINAYDSNKGYTLNLVKGRASPISIKINNTKR